MKKAKVLIPAIAVLALSAASAVTGTVAWFTATRTATVSTTGLTVVNTEASLIAKPKADGSSTKMNEDGKTVEHQTLRDGSVDLKNDTVGVWKALVGDDENVQPTTFEKLTGSLSDTVDDAGNPVFRATHFTIDFYFKEAIGKSDVYGLFFDITNSAVTGAGANDALLPALRVGMRSQVAETGAKETIVWAPKAGSVSSLTYVNAASGPYATYGATEIATGSTVTSYTKAEQAHNVLRLGDLKLENISTKPLTIDVYTWWEGSDAVCINNNSTIGAVNYNLQFNLVKQTEK